MPASYQVNPKHRNNSHHGSQWTISPENEHACFRAAEGYGWLLDSVGWGLHWEDENVDYLGVAVDRARRLFVAKFVTGSVPVVWHGYPADPEKNNQDIPSEAVLNLWLESKILAAPKIRKLQKGQPCRL